MEAKSSTAAWRFHLKGKLVLRDAYQSLLGPRPGVRESACENSRMSQQVDRIYP